MKVLLTTICLLGVIPASAATIHGTVLDHEGEPVDGAVVELYVVAVSGADTADCAPDGLSPIVGDEAIDILLVDDQPRPFDSKADYSTTTDDEGDYRLSGVEPGLYDIACYAVQCEMTYRTDIELAGDDDLSLDFTLGPMLAVDKPNIYLYPVEAGLVSVGLGFPQGGGITVSEPIYDHGWSVEITPAGVIDGEWDYLFYEAAAPDRWRREAGWVVAAENLETFFRENLSATGFYPAEIEDFVDWWIPRLDDAPYYALYPQYNDVYDGVITLSVEPEPRTVIRLIYVIEGLDEPLELPEPLIPAYEAGGFTVHEWGVVRDGGVLE
ncbi:MAG: hypothetical protein GF403_00180 [Candidatus Coatesbacteria bacterium]|nr:hypothetical protein [Candidatus Coatesbacteria bacterium]